MYIGWPVDSPPDILGHSSQQERTQGSAEGPQGQAIGSNLEGLRSSPRNNLFLSSFDMQFLSYLSPLGTGTSHRQAATHQWLRDEQRRGRARRVGSQPQHLGLVLCCVVVSMLCALRSMVSVVSTHSGPIVPYLLVVKSQLTVDITHVLLEAKLSSRKHHMLLIKVGSQHS